MGQFGPYLNESVAVWYGTWSAELVWLWVDVHAAPIMFVESDGQWSSLMLLESIMRMFWCCTSPVHSQLKWMSCVSFVGEQAKDDDPEEELGEGLEEKFGIHGLFGLILQFFCGHRKRTFLFRMVMEGRVFTV